MSCPLQQVLFQIPLPETSKTLYARLHLGHIYLRLMIINLYFLLPKTVPRFKTPTTQRLANISNRTISLCLGEF
jgi:hypothetical protein